ncbi:mannitol dehydrogenase family protein [Treponema primitia]|uniref:mannitol dehydrogenase family protein n=1 Tax=Treponema primitia TaxID=88058 RepID=UPI0039801318
MLLLNRKSVKEQKVEFEKAGIRIPSFDIDAVRDRSFAAPVWVHFSVGNLFKAYHAMLAQRLIEMGAMDRGIVAVAPLDHGLIKKVFLPHDNLYIHVTMKADGSLEKSVVAGVTEALAADSADTAQWERLKTIFCAPSLQIVSLSITEKGYELRNMDGSFKPEILKEFEAGPVAPVHGMTKLTALLYERYTKGSGRPLALVSTDNFSHNGDKLKAAVLAVAGEWKARSFVDPGFVNWLSDPAKAAFPLTMIDKITPYPSEKVRDQLEAAGLGGMEIINTGGHSVNAPFVNTEEAEYLVIEDIFPNGRPPLEKAGVYFTDRETVDRVEKMKVCTCLNPLHTALAVFGCLLGYSSIAAEMKDPDLVSLVRKIAYDEGMPVVTNPGIIQPADFVREVLEKRFPNPNIPDTPQRIATDTSQKLGIRFGETIKLYTLNPKLHTKNLVLIPLVLAAWCRYLLGLDDSGKAFTPSPDPLLTTLQETLQGLSLGAPGSAAGKLRPILSNQKIFAVNLYEVGLGELIEGYFSELLAGPGAVRKTLQKYLGHHGRGDGVFSG